MTAATFASERRRPFSVVRAPSGAYIPTGARMPSRCTSYREYDIRGLVANELTPEFAEQLGRGFGRYLVEKNRARRAWCSAAIPPLSEGLAAGFSRGVRSHGIDVISIDVVPTPAPRTLRAPSCGGRTVHDSPARTPAELQNGFKVGIGKTTLAAPKCRSSRRAWPRPGWRPNRARDRHDIITPYIHFVVESLG